jgi:hypothetical protein
MDMGRDLDYDARWIMSRPKRKFKPGDIVEYDSGNHFPAGKGAIGIVTEWEDREEDVEGPIVSWITSPDSRFFTEWNHRRFFHEFIKPFSREVPDGEG